MGTLTFAAGMAYRFIDILTFFDTSVISIGKSQRPIYQVWPNIGSEFLLNFSDFPPDLLQGY